MTRCPRNCSHHQSLQRSCCYCLHSDERPCSLQQSPTWTQHHLVKESSDNSTCPLRIARDLLCPGPIFMGWDSNVTLLTRYTVDYHYPTQTSYINLLCSQYLVAGLQYSVYTAHLLTHCVPTDLCPACVCSSCCPVFHSHLPAFSLTRLSSWRPQPQGSWTFELEMDIDLIINLSLLSSIYSRKLANMISTTQDCMHTLIGQQCQPQ